MSRKLWWIIGLAVLLAGCAVKPVTPPATLDVVGQPAALAGASPTDLAATEAAASGAALPTSTDNPNLAATSAVATTQSVVTTQSGVGTQSPATPRSPAAPTLPATLIATVVATAIAADATPTPALIVIAQVPLVPAPTATKPPVAVARPRPTQASAAAPTEPSSAAQPTSTVPPAAAVPLSGDVAAAEQNTVDLINAQRTALALSPLAANPTLMSIANSRVADMVARGYTGHNDPTTGVALGPALMRAAGFGGLVGENWYGSRLGPPSIADIAMKWFMTDPPHYHNILGPGYTGVGVGIAYNGQQWLLIQDFAGN